MFSKLFALSVAALSVVAVPTSDTTTSHFKNFFLIILENTNYASAIADPNLAAFAKKGKLFTNWQAVSHPSQPNYIAMTSGSTGLYVSDLTMDSSAKNIVDLLENKHLSWKSYQENWPGNCYTGTQNGTYYRKHNPFASYTDITTNATRCAKIVDASQLQKDIKSNKLPTFAWYTPNINDDGHDTNVSFAGQWLSGFLKSTSLLSHYDVVLVTFDESETYLPPNSVYTAIAGRAVKAGKNDSTALTHYSVLATLEKNFALGNLGQNDATATPFTSS